MSIPGAGNPLLLGGAAGGYKIDRSLRFNSADTAYLRRTPTSAGNRKTWTWSGWVKRCEFGASLQQVLLGSLAGAGATQTMIGFLYDNIDVFYYNGSFYRSNSVAVIRDPAAWYHIVYAIDTTQASTSDRCKVYVNGAQITMSAWTVPQNTDTLINAASQSHDIGTLDGGTYYKFNGYLADVHFIDGQALTPSSFGETDTNGIWQPKAYSGSYGTNGFQLKFADNSAATATTLGKDTSGNGNNWTPNNLSVTAGVGNDSLVDSPINYGTDTGAGGEVRGNYCTWNPLTASITGATLSNGNLDLQTPVTNYGLTHGTVGVSSGKWYWEIRINSLGDALIGIDSRNVTASNLYLGAGVSYSYTNSGTKYGPNDTSASYGASYVANDVIGVALDLDAGTLSFYKNGTSQGQAFSGITGTFFPAFSDGSASMVAGASITANFGQRPFAYTAPSGFKALCTANLPAPTIVKPSTVMDVVTYTGTGSTLTPTSTLGFNPDLIWIKSRSAATDHALYDSVRGAQARLESNTTGAEATSDSGVTAFNTAGFTLGTLAQVNTNAATYAAWTWDAGSSTVTNTAGTISSQVRANANAGFSVITYTGSGSAATVGHGLGAAPKFLIWKARSAVTNWMVWHSSLSANNYLNLDNTAAQTSAGQPPITSTLPDSSVITMAYGQGYYNGSGTTYVCYAFAPVAGYSAFGSYTGNGSADGPMVFTNMRPRWIMIKRTDSTGNWTIIDAAREGYNVDNDPLYPNTADAEGTADLADIVSNGFKLRSTDASVNASAGTYVYACFAEAPFSLARAR